MAGERVGRIMATVADNRCTPEFLGELFSLGVEQVRVNSAHVGPERLAEMVGMMRGVNPAVEILTDTKGPEIRTGMIADGASQVAFSAGDEFVLLPASAGASTSPGESIPGESIPGESIPGVIALGCGPLRADSFAAGQRMLIDDGTVVMEVVGADAGGYPVVRATADGVLLPRKGVTFPGITVDGLEAVTEADEANLRMAARLGLDMVAHSFVRSADDVMAVRKVLLSEGGAGVKLFAKIECVAGLSAFSSILEAADGILIARGDLGAEVDPALIPALQREIMMRCRRAGKPVIIATQFLQSMMTSPMATRAEMTDIAVAVGQGASTLLLCGETAAGAYPLEAVATMRRAIEGASADVAGMLG